MFVLSGEGVAWLLLSLDRLGINDIFLDDKEVGVVLEVAATAATLVLTLELAFGMRSEVTLMLTSTTTRTWTILVEWALVSATMTSELMRAELLSVHKMLAHVLELGWEDQCPSGHGHEENGDDLEAARALAQLASPLVHLGLFPNKAVFKLVS